MARAVGFGGTFPPCFDAIQTECTWGNQANSANCSRGLFYCVLLAILLANSICRRSIATSTRDLPARTKSMRDRFGALLAQIQSVRESIRDKRIGHTDPDWNVIDLFRQLRFDWARLIDIEHDGRRGIILEGPQTNPEHCGLPHQIRTMLFQDSVCAVECLLRELK